MKRTTHTIANTGKKSGKVIVAEFGARPRKTAVHCTGVAASVHLPTLRRRKAPTARGVNLTIV